MDLEVGSIVYIKNICFERSGNNKFTVDHAYRNGRPCVYIGEKNNKDYFLPISHDVPHLTRRNHLKPDDNNNLAKISMVNFYKIIKLNPCYHEVEGVLSLTDMLTVSSKAVAFFKKDEREDGKVILDLAREFIRKHPFYLDKDNKIILKNK